MWFSSRGRPRPSFCHLFSFVDVYTLFIRVLLDRAVKDHRGSSAGLMFNSVSADCFHLQDSHFHLRVFLPNNKQKQTLVFMQHTPVHLFLRGLEAHTQGLSAQQPGQLCRSDVIRTRRQVPAGVSEWRSGSTNKNTPLKSEFIEEQKNNPEEFGSISILSF